MSFLMILRIAIKALNRNKMRTALTMLGMIIGVAAVITMVALGSGAQTSIETQIQSAGTNMIIVSAGNFSQGGVRQGQGNASTLTPDDAAVEEGGLAVREPSAKDRRVYSLRITEKGLETLRKIGLVYQEHNAAITAALSSEERETLTSLLERIVGSIACGTPNSLSSCLSHESVCKFINWVRLALVTSVT